MMSLAVKLRDRIKEQPLIRARRERRYERFFATPAAYGCFRGVFSTFAEAQRSAPRTMALGYDTERYAHEYADRMTRVFPYDYPPLFWLERLLGVNPSVFDYGGHVGVQFYGYERYLRYPGELRWTVCDLPALTTRGEQIARERRRTEIGFTHRFEDAADHDILIAAGSLQYIEQPSFPESLRALKRRPKHLLLNKLPLGKGPEFVTLQNGRVFFAPQYVFNEAAFIGALVALGYEVVDRWEDLTHSCVIPFHEDRAVVPYSGLYLRARE